MFQPKDVNCMTFRLTNVNSLKINELDHVTITKKSLFHITLL